MTQLTAAPGDRVHYVTQEGTCKLARVTRISDTASGAIALNMNDTRLRVIAYPSTDHNPGTWHPEH
jgi:hypothetical protein